MLLLLAGLLLLPLLAKLHCCCWSLNSCIGSCLFLLLAKLLPELQLLLCWLLLLLAMLLLLLLELQMLLA
jgi:hypothetical protein